MADRALNRKEQLEYEATGKWLNTMNESGLLNKGRTGTLYVVDFKSKKLVGKGEKALDKLENK